MLRYLFEVTFKDGSVYKQNKKDISETDPKRSCYFDIAQKLDQVKEFSLVRESLLNPVRFTVNIEQGYFLRNGEVFELAGETMDTPVKTITDRELIYFRRRREHMSAQSGEHIGSEVMYFFGWKGVDSDGNEVIRTIGIE